MSPTSYHCSTPRWAGAAPTYCPSGGAASIVGAGAFHDRVRDGNGWSHPAHGTAPVGTARPGLVQRLRSAPDPAGGTPAGERAGRPRPLVPLRCVRYRTSTGGLSTRSSPWGLTLRRDGRPHLAVGFALRCVQRLSLPDDGYRAVPWAGQLVHRRSVRPGPLVLGATPRKSPTPTTDRDRTVSRRSEPSSRTALMGEQPNPWEGLPPQDATSRHRGAKPCRRWGLSGKISLLSPG
jgi:hypothetical protein